MAYHHACYEKQVGRTAKKAVSKKVGFTCQICHMPIQVGEFFTWTRRGQGASYPSSGNEPPDMTPLPDVVPVPGQTPLGGKYDIHGYSPGENGSAQSDDSGTEDQIPFGGVFNIGALLKALTPGVAAAVAKELDGKLKAANQSPTVETSIKVHHVILTTNKTEEFESAGIQHRMFPRLLKMLNTGVNVWIAGPAGSGKTRAVMEAAKVLGKDFYFTGAVGDQYGLSGYMNAEGKYVESNFFRCFTKGGIFLWDEVDSSDASAVLWANAAIENGMAAFPHGIFQRHPDCIIVAAGNTWGHGATNEYVGRAKQDMAFLSRFAKLPWNYDEDLEVHLAVNKDWARRVQQVRKRVAEKGLRILITPRSTFYGDKLLSGGLSQDEVEESCLREGMTEDQWNQVK